MQVLENLLKTMTPAQRAQLYEKASATIFGPIQRDVLAPHKMQLYVMARLKYIPWKEHATLHGKNMRLDLHQLHILVLTKNDRRCNAGLLRSHYNVPSQLHNSACFA